jgi:hypothetical protein
VTTRDLKAIVDDLLALPFPREDTWAGDRHSGPGFHVRVLHAGQDFWDDRGEEIVEAAEEEINAPELPIELLAAVGEAPIP